MIRILVLVPLLLALGISVRAAQPDNGEGGEPVAGSPVNFDRALMYPDLRVLPAEELYFDTAVIDGEEQAVLRFTTVFGNLGKGPLELVGKTDPKTGETRVVQRLASGDGERHSTVPAGNFEFHDGHEHWHTSDFLLFELHRAEGARLIEAVQGAVSKASFCVRDDVQLTRLTGSPELPEFVGCGNEVQGLSVGWADIYSSELDDQWVVLGAPNGAAPLADGRYALVKVVNPGGHVFEDNRNNNQSVTYFRVEGGSIIID